MALWSNTDAAASAPEGNSATGFAATGVAANGYTMWANTRPSVFTTNQQVGVLDGAGHEVKDGTVATNKLMQVRLFGNTTNTDGRLTTN